MLLKHTLCAAGILCLTLSAAFAGQTTQEQVKQDGEQAGTWIYDDVAAGFAEAGKTGKPLLFVFR